MTVQEHGIGLRGAVRRARRAGFTAPIQEAAARIVHTKGEGRIRHLMVTGAERRVGASVVARGLADTLSDACGRVLLIEVRGDGEDLPGLERMLEGSPMMSTAGSARVRLGEAEFEAMALLGLTALKTHFALLLQHFDLVVWDVRPVGSAPGAVMAAPLMDGITLVVRTDRTRQRHAAQATQRLQDAGGHMVGVVMNRTRRRLPRWLDRLL